MRLLPIIILSLTGSLAAGEATAYPLWDGQETVADYAKRVNLPATKTLDLGNGVKMELVLIPAGIFIMGTPEPTAVDEDGFHKRILTGQALLAVSATALLVILVVVIGKAVRKRQRPKFSLLWLLAMTVMAGSCVLGGLHWRQSAKGLADYQAAMARFKAASDNEKHAHLVTLPQPYYMGKYVVTQKQYQVVTGENPSCFKGNDNPVDHLIWDEAVDFCRKAASQTRQSIRLPKEPEWEFACRAGTTTTYNSGDAESDLARVGWYSSNSNSTSHPVGQKEPNAFDLYDMHGNICEWCMDSDPQGYGVLRGGSWESLPIGCTSAFRRKDSPAMRYMDTGFRVVVPVIGQP